MVEQLLTFLGSNWYEPRNRQSKRVISKKRHQRRQKTKKSVNFKTQANTTTDVSSYTSDESSNNEPEKVNKK